MEAFKNSQGVIHRKWRKIAPDPHRYPCISTPSAKILPDSAGLMKPAFLIVQISRGYVTRLLCTAPLAARLY